MTAATSTSPTSRLRALRHALRATTGTVGMLRTPAEIAQWRHDEITADLAAIQAQRKLLRQTGTVTGDAVTLADLDELEADLWDALADAATLTVTA